MQSDAVPGTFVLSKLVLLGLVLCRVAPETFVLSMLVPWSHVHWSTVLATFVQSRWRLYWCSAFRWYFLQLRRQASRARLEQRGPFIFGTHFGRGGLCSCPPWTHQGGAAAKGRGVPGRGFC